MADLNQLERALVNADKAGDTAAATTLAAEIRRARSNQPAGPQKFDLRNDAARRIENYSGRDAIGGAIRGSGSIGSTLLAPFDLAEDALFRLRGIDRGNTNQQRRASLDPAIS